MSYTTLESDSNSSATFAALLNSQLTVKFVDTLLASPERPILPRFTIVNVNFSPLDSCASVDDYSFVLTRLLPDPLHLAKDVYTCGTSHLPDEKSVINSSGCYATVSVLSSITKLDVGALAQVEVLNRISSILSCI